MSIQAWLGDMSKQQFVADYYHKLPYSRGGGARAACPLGSWDVLDELLRSEAADVLVVERGRRRSEAAGSGDAARRLVDEGCTVLIRHAERHHQALSELAEAFRADFGAPVNIHVYVTGGGQFGFGWHYDAEDVFIVQTQGRKQYALRKNTVNPWPLEETLPDDMHYERELMPLMKCLLSPGDWLYIPGGYWHMAEAQGEEPSISLAIGVMSRTAVDVFDRLRGRLLQSLLWRQRLPVTGGASPLSVAELRAQYRELLAQLGEDLSRCIQEDGFLDDLVSGEW